MGSLSFVTADGQYAWYSMEVRDACAITAMGCVGYFMHSARVGSECIGMCHVTVLNGPFAPEKHVNWLVQFPVGSCCTATVHLFMRILAACGAANEQTPVLACMH